MSAALKKDDRVVVDPNIPCRDCEFCRSGHTNLCPNMTTLGIFQNGGLARYSLAPASALHRIASEVPPERAVLAEPLSCIFAAYEKAPVGDVTASWSSVPGPIGLAFILLYRKMGAGTIVAVEPREFGAVSRWIWAPIRRSTFKADELPSKIGKTSAAAPISSSTPPAPCSLPHSKLSGREAPL